jgi:hypothetical protein
MQCYEVRVDGVAREAFAKLEEALRCARDMVARDADMDPEIIDRRTGRACMVAASKRWRDEIAAVLGA